MEDYKMKKRIITTLFVAVLGLSSSITAFAAPKTMPDGSVFDAAYYAAAYPDVAVALGTSESALYNHYLQYGKAEGRKPTAQSSQVTSPASPIAGATLVSSRETWGAAVKTYRIEQYSNGIWRTVALEGFSDAHDPQYWILRTDYSDGLLDKDGNGIDDRDPYNTCGYTDLNHNCLADGAPVKEGYTPENKHVPFWTCSHGVVNGSDICQKQKCKNFREAMKRARVY